MDDRHHFLHALWILRGHLRPLRLDLTTLANIHLLHRAIAALLQEKTHLSPMVCLGS